MPSKPLSTLLAMCALATALSQSFSGEQPVLLAGNMVGNPSFEYDFHNNNAEGHVLAFRGDWSFNNSDAKPDYWDPQGPWQYFEGDAHTGKRALLLKGGASVSRSFTAGVISGGRGSGDWRWAGPPEAPMSYDNPIKVARGVRAQLWYRSRALGGANTLTLTVNSFGVSKSEQAAQDAPDWQPLVVTLTRQEIEQAQPTELPRSLTLTIAVSGNAEVLIDDVSLTENLTEDPNLAVNPSFEELDRNGYPAGWSTPKKYVWRPPQYYQWTDWHHRFSDNRGPVASCDLVAHSGRRSLLMQVYPGDEMMVESAPVTLNQADRGVVEIGAFVLADRAKWLDIRAIDQDGNDVPAIAAFSGGWKTPPDGHQIFPSNAHSWVYIRKWFQGAAPLKALRVQLCARGFNGDTRDDGGHRPQVCQTGLVWWDDVRVSERSATADELRRRNLRPAPAAPAPDSVMVTALDLGERFYGLNSASVTLSNHARKTLSADLALQVEGKPAGEPAAVRLEPGQSQTVLLPYRITQLEGRWNSQGRFDLSLTVGGNTRTLSLAYNTWPVLADVDLRHVPAVAENPQHITINLGVAKATLDQVKSLVVETITRRDHRAVQTIDLGEPAKAFAETVARFDQFPKAEFGVPGPVQYADRNNLIVLRLDLANLPAHPFDHPVLDHHLRVRGLDAQGDELFSDISQPFGRVQPVNETLPRITRTEVRQDGVVLINGQPVFIMAGNAYTTADYSLNPAQNKAYGHNAIRWVESPEAAAKNWEANMYSLETMVRDVPFDQGPDAVRQNLEPRLREWIAQGAFDGVITISPFYEHSCTWDTPQQVAGQAAYTQVANEVANRITNFGGGGAHNIYTLEKVFDAYDSFGLEIEPMGPPRGGFELAPVLRRRPVAWFHLPQTYSTTPYEQFRFDQYAMILQGGYGFSTIHGLGDPSFMRALTGELRYLSPAIFSLDHGPENTSVSPDLWWMQRRNGNEVTLIVASKPPAEIGRWTWRENNVASGQRAHTGISEFAPNPTPDGIRLHGFREAKPVMMHAGDRIITHVWLDPKATPSAIAWGVRGDAKWDFNGHWGRAFDFAKWRTDFIHFWLGGELLPGTWQISWQVNERTHDWFADHILVPATFKGKGALPPAGQWTKLELTAEELGLVGKQVDGAFFLAKDGEAWWDRTAIVRGNQEIVLCDDSVGPPQDELAATRISLPWAADRTRISVLFEERDLVVQDGAFVDDFRGVDTYQSVRGGAIGDVAGWYPAGAPDSNLRAQTIGYVTPNGPVAVHIYEITLAQ